jgi:hypothetical protein
MHQGSHTAYLLLYVDDIVLTTSSSPLLTKIINGLQQEFSMSDLGPLQQDYSYHKSSMQWSYWIKQTCQTAIHVLLMLTQQLNYQVQLKNHWKMQLNTAA